MFFYALRGLDFQVNKGSMDKSEAFQTLVAVLMHDIGKISAYTKKEKQGHHIISVSICEKFFDLPFAVVDTVRHYHKRRIQSGGIVVEEAEERRPIRDKLILYDRTERQMEVTILAPYDRGLKLPDTARFTEEDLAYLQKWLVESPVPADEAQAGGGSYVVNQKNYLTPSQKSEEETPAVQGEQKDEGETAAKDPVVEVIVGVKRFLSAKGIEPKDRGDRVEILLEWFRDSDPVLHEEGSRLWKELWNLAKSEDEPRIKKGNMFVLVSKELYEETSL